MSDNPLDPSRGMQSHRSQGVDERCRHLTNLLKDNEALGPTITALAEIGEAAIPYLIATFLDASSGVLAKFCCIESLIAIGNKASDALIALLEDGSHSSHSLVVNGLCNMGPDVLPLASALLASDDDSLCLDSVIVIRTLGAVSKSSLPALYKLLDRQSPRLRCEAAEAIATVAPEELSNELLVEALYDMMRSSEYRRRAGELMLKMGPSAVPVLIKVLRRGDDFGRMCAAEFLGRIGPDAKDAVRKLTHTFITDRCEVVRMYAAEALGRIGPVTHQTKYRLMEHYEDFDGNIRSTIGLAIKRLDPEFYFRRFPDGQPSDGDLSGIDVMGDDALKILNALITFQRIGAICKEKGSDSFVIGDMEKLLGIDRCTIQVHLNHVRDFFIVYFMRYRKIDVIACKERAPRDRKLFDRRSGIPPTICRPLGWDAWELTCRYVDARDQVDLARRRAARHKR